MDELQTSLDFRWFPFDSQTLELHFRALNSKDGENVVGSFPLKPARFLFGVMPHKLAEWDVDCHTVTYKEDGATSNQVRFEYIYLWACACVHWGAGGSSFLYPLRLTLFFCYSF
jgi:hypothetical protein